MGYKGWTSLSLKDVKTLLDSKELIDKEFNGVSNDHQVKGLLVQNEWKVWSSRKKNLERSKFESRLNNLTYFYCHKKGHKKVDFYLLKNKQLKNQNSKEVVEANIIEKEACDKMLLMVDDVSRSSD